MVEIINSLIAELNNAGHWFCGYAGGVFIQSSAVIIFLLVIDLLLRKKVRAVFRYCLWMLVFVKLLLPASFALPTGIGYWAGDYFNSREIAEAAAVEMSPVFNGIWDDVVFGPAVVDSTDMVVVDDVKLKLAAVSWEAVLFLLWAAGMVVLLVLVVQRIYFVRGLISRSRQCNENMAELLNDCRRKVGVASDVGLRVSDSIASPAVCGLFRPVILMSSELVGRLSDKQMRIVLVHELSHVKRGDIWVNILQTLLQIVYFYNPLVWVANAIVRRVREQAVDEMVLVALGGKNKSYSNVLIDIAEMVFCKPRFGLRLIGVVESRGALEGRIKHMLNRKVPKSSKLGVCGLLVVVIVGLVVLPMACSADQKDDTKDVTQYIKAESNIIVPGLRVGEYTFGMTREDVLEKLGKPKRIFYKDKDYTLDDLPSKYYLCFKGISFRIADDVVREICVSNRLYEFDNGLGVGDTEEKIKQTFGDNFELKETQWKDFLIYKEHCLQFEISKAGRKILEFSVYPKETFRFYSGGEQVSDAEFAEKLVERIEKLDIDNAGLADVKEIFGEPFKYTWGKETFTKDDLPSHYIMIYPSHFCVYMRDDKIVEIRHEPGSEYVYNGKLKSGSTLEEVFEVVGEPDRTVVGMDNTYEDGVLYKDINGDKGYCYYARRDQNVRFWFTKYKLVSIYMIRSDHRKEVDAKPKARMSRRSRRVVKNVEKSDSQKSKVKGVLRIEFEKEVKNLSRNMVIQQSKTTRELTYSNLVSGDIQNPNEVDDQMIKNRIRFGDIIKMLEAGVGTTVLLDSQEMYEEKDDAGNDNMVTVKVTLTVN